MRVCGEERVKGLMANIIITMTPSKKVSVWYSDEIGLSPWNMGEGTECVFVYKCRYVCE